eukprot:PITA_08968
MRDNLHGGSSSHSPDDNKYRSPVTFTVWKKSLLFNGEGFTVFDSSGNLVFRVDNYASNVERELFLMDAVGNVLLTLHRDKRLSLSQRWEAFRGDGVGCGKPEFSVIIKSSCWLFSSKALAKVLVTEAEGEKITERFAITIIKSRDPSKVKDMFGQYGISISSFIGSFGLVAVAVQTKRSDI